MWWIYLLVFWLGGLLGYAVCALMVMASVDRCIRQGHCRPEKMR